MLGMRTCKAKVVPSLFCFLLCVVWSVSVAAAPVQVRYKEGLIHGFLVMSTMDGERVADGDMLQTGNGNRITNHLIFHYKDGSLWDETVVFSQRGSFRLLSYHLVQKGNSFHPNLEETFETSKGIVTVRYTDDEGKEKVATERMKLPADVSNGLVLTLLKNVGPNAPPIELSMVAATPKPRLVKLAISAQGDDPFTLGATHHKSIHYVVKVEIGGIAGLVAPLLGKQPPDSHVWILGGEAPAFVKSEGLFYLGGPIWRVELVAPAWPKDTSSKSKNESAAKR